MPHQKQKGKNNIRKNRFRSELILPKENQLVAIIEASHGGYPPRFSCKVVHNDKKIIAPLQGSIAKGPKRVRVLKGDYVLLDTIPCTTTFEAYYIHHVYTKNDVNELRKRQFLEKVEKGKEETNSSDIIFSQDDLKVISNNHDRGIYSQKLNIDDI